MLFSFQNFQIHYISDIWFIEKVFQFWGPTYYPVHGELEYTFTNDAWNLCKLVKIEFESQSKTQKCSKLTLAPIPCISTGNSCLFLDIRFEYQSSLWGHSIITFALRGGGDPLKCKGM